MKILFLLFVFSSITFAQISSGTFYGQVRDKSGGLVSDVRITAQQEGTGFSRASFTDRSGVYRIPELSPGTYSLTAGRTGFRTFVSSHLILEVNQEAKVDITLQVGPVRDSITVSESVSPLQTDDSSEGYRFGSAAFTELPLDGRNVLSLVTLGPGAIPRQLGGFTHDSDNDVQESSRGSVALNPPINGARPSANSYILDGAYNTDRNTFSTVIIPPMDSVQEFRVQSSLAGAEFAQAGGGVIDVVTKAGSKDYHGGGFEFLRNEATDAHN
ncbi:MAG: carboxypeptidase-like regulatory domain-containing protein, partial [Bryobacteraceae bacterium]